MQHVPDPAALGARLIQLREARGFSQRDLAEAAGCSYAYVSRVETGGRQPSEHLLVRLAAKLGVSVRYLKTGDPDPVELGLAEGRLTLDDLTADERARLDERVEAATFAAARDLARDFRRHRETATTEAA